MNLELTAASRSLRERESESVISSGGPPFPWLIVNQEAVQCTEGQRGAVKNKEGEKKKKLWITLQACETDPGGAWLNNASSSAYEPVPRCRRLSTPPRSVPVPVSVSPPPPQSTISIPRPLSPFTESPRGGIHPRDQSSGAQPPLCLMLACVQCESIHHTGYTGSGQGCRARRDGRQCWRESLMASFPWLTNSLGQVSVLYRSRKVRVNSGSR